jgi:hypothetical protein
MGRPETKFGTAHFPFSKGDANIEYFTENPIFLPKVFLLLFPAL